MLVKAGSIGNYQVSELSNSNIRKSTLGRLLSISTVPGTFLLITELRLSFCAYRISVLATKDETTKSRQLRDAEALYGRNS